jgi:hypothetical protein
MKNTRTVSQHNLIDVPDKYTGSFLQVKPVANKKLQYFVTYLIGSFIALHEGGSIPFRNVG